jgi:ABC-type transport system involved in multi-copper enzyme maturation permease subunit
MNLSLLATCVILAVAQFLALIPWGTAVGLIPSGSVRKSGFWLAGIGAAAGIGLALGLFLNANNDPRVLSHWGRFVASVLHLQLSFDIFVGLFLVMLMIWPKGGAVALAAFQEGLRQPTYWLLTLAASAIMLLSTIVPFFTFGEDIKVVRELCFTFTMLMPAAFALLTASMSVSEEIEGRTAVTLMSKPIMRRDFLLGKFTGIVLAALTMTILLGWWLIWMVLLKEYLDPPIVPVEIPDPDWVTQLRSAFGQGSVSDLVRGMGLWTDDVLEALPGLAIGFCQVMIISAFAIALATRVPMVVNIVACMAIYFLGHLTTVLTDVTARSNPLVRFLARTIDTVLPELDVFDVGAAVVRDTPIPTMEYATYAGHVVVYGLIFSAIALLLGLILFEDRDLA